MRERSASWVDAAVLRRVVNNMSDPSWHTPSGGRASSSRRAAAIRSRLRSPTRTRLSDAKRRDAVLRQGRHSPRPRTAIRNGGLGHLVCRTPPFEAHRREVDIVESAEWPTSVIMSFRRPRSCIWVPVHVPVPVPDQTPKQRAPPVGCPRRRPPKKKADEQRPHLPRSARSRRYLGSDRRAGCATRAMFVGTFRWARKSFAHR